MALEAKVRTYEQVQETLQQEDVMTRLVERLEIQKQESAGWSYELGREQGERWAINDADYADLVVWEGIYADPPYGPPGRPMALPGEPIPFPHNVESAEEWYENALEAAREEGKALDHDQYAIGFLDAMHEVWKRVAPKL